MEFANSVHKTTYEQVTTLMRELFGEMAQARNDIPAFLVCLGSAIVQITVWPWTDDECIVNARSWVVRGPDVTPELMSFLLHENSKMRFGAFGIDDDNDIFFNHSIVGSTIDKIELKTTVLAVLSTADRYDDDIRSRWGGQRGTD